MSFLYPQEFLDALTDEVKLDQNARHWLKAHEGELTIESLRAIHASQGIALATRVLFVYLSEYQHRDIQQWVDRELPRNINRHLFPEAKSIKLLIVPGMFYREYPEIGSDGQLMVSIGKRLGFTVDRVPLKSIGAVVDNIDLLKQAIDKSSDHLLWLISLSKGSLEVRGYLQRHAKEVPAHLKGWVNINGICFGSPVVDSKLATPFARFFNRLVCLLHGFPYQHLAELTTKYPEWQQPFPTPPSVTMVHMAGMPLASHVHKQLQRRYHYLSQFGPNEGLFLLEDYLRLPGSIVSVWGIDHMLRTPNMSALFYKLCYFIYHQEYGGEPKD